MTTYSSILARKISWTAESDGVCMESYSPQGRKESDTTELLHSHTRTRSRIMELPSALPSELPLFSSWSGQFPLPSSTSSQPLLLLIMFSGQFSPAWVNPLPMCSVSPSVQPVGLCNVAFYSLIQVLNYVANPLGSDGGTDGSTCPLGFILSTELSYCMETIDCVFVKQMNRHVSE